MKRLNIPNYIGECYYYRTISCTHAPFAIASGYYNHDNYFYYCAYYSIYSIWREEDNYFQIYNSILGKLGLGIIPVNTDTKELLFESIRENLNNNIPIITFLDYFDMFYYDFNYQERHGVHAVIINGIDDNKSTITIMDCAHIGFDNPFRSLTLTKEIFWDMWQKSNYYFKENGFENSFKVFLLISKESEKVIDNEFSFLEDFVNNYSITSYDSIINNMINNNFNIFYSELYKRDLLDSINSIIHILDKLTIDDDAMDEYKNAKERFIADRTAIFVSIIKNYYKDEKLSEEYRNMLINSIYAMNKEFYSLLLKLYNNCLIKEKQIIKNHLKDYAIEAKVEASSELKAYGTIFYAKRVINGKFQDFIYDTWMSIDKAIPHWLIIDLGEPINLYKVVIIHDYRSQDLFLVDFIIQGSNNKEKWDDMDVVSGNKKSYTTHYCNNNKYRYYRIYITKASRIDNSARILGVECWGSRKIWG